MLFLVKLDDVMCLDDLRQNGNMSESSMTHVNTPISHLTDRIGAVTPAEETHEHTTFFPDRVSFSSFVWAPCPNFPSGRLGAMAEDDGC